MSLGEPRRNRFPSVLLQPLGHLSVQVGQQFTATAQSRKPDCEVNVKRLAFRRTRGPFCAPQLERAGVLELNTWRVAGASEWGVIYSPRFDSTEMRW